MAKLPILYWSLSSGPTDKDHLFWEQFPYKENLTETGVQEQTAQKKKSEKIAAINIKASVPFLEKPINSEYINIALED